MFTSQTLRRTVIIAASLIGLAGFAETASASSGGHRDPRRVEVDHRLALVSNRIAHEVSIGKMTPAWATRLLREIRHVRREERVMAAHDHGRITKAEQIALNAHENAIGRRIVK
jgi:hypothetical protein